MLNAAPAEAGTLRWSFFVRWEQLKSDPRLYVNDLCNKSALNVIFVECVQAFNKIHTEATLYMETAV